jgi:L-amino acid N-acyltransferase YncA
LKEEVKLLVLSKRKSVIINMKTDLTFHNASIHDLDKIVDIYNSTIPLRTVTADTEPVTEESRLNWFNAHNGKEYPLWIVKKGDAIVAWVSFQPFYGRPAYKATAEISVYLDEKCRGKGYGKVILKHAIEQCPKFRIKTLLGFIFANNHPSIKLFNTMGFMEWGNLSNIAEIDGHELSLKILGMRVAQ